MARKFEELREKMSPESQARAEAMAREMMADIRSMQTNRPSVKSQDEHTESGLSTGLDRQNNRGD